jgi:hypothetical protein
MSFEQDLSERYAGAHARLYGTPAAPAPKVVRTSPPVEASVPPPTRVVILFGKATMQQRIDRLFPLPIVEIDDDGAPVVRVLFKAHWREIAEQSAAKHHVTLLDLRSARRDQAVVKARHEAFWRCRNETTLSLPEIGRRFGGRDHTTVLHGIRKHVQRTLAAALQEPAGR